MLHYTVGQRRGLGISAPEPLYVLAIDATRNRITLGPRRALERRRFVTGAANWLLPSIQM